MKEFMFCTSYAILYYYSIIVFRLKIWFAFKDLSISLDHRESFVDVNSSFSYNSVINILELSQTILNIYYAEKIHTYIYTHMYTIDKYGIPTLTNKVIVFEI